MAYDPASAHLFVFAPSGGSADLVRFDPATNAAVSVGPLGLALPTDITGGMTVDDTGRLLLSFGDPGGAAGNSA